jgi:TIR domain-containing protein
MAYVPGYSNDIFLSYAHGDDPAWFQAFEQALARAVRGRLGHDVDLWRDLKHLRVGQDWESEIAEAIATTAAFVAVLSPSYQTSNWCSRELSTFLGPGGSLDGIKMGEFHRLLKVVKIPWEGNDHESFFPRLQHVPFFRKVDDPREYIEFPLASDAFDGSLQELAAAVTALLRVMRRRLQKVFVAAPAEDVSDAWNRVRKQLLDDRYDVRPDGVLNAGYDDKVILREVENAVLTVHLLGAAYDAFAERQFRLAAEAGRRQLIWFSKGTEREDQVDAKQWRLLESIRKKEGLQTGFDWFLGTIQEMIAQVQVALRPKKAEAAAEPGAGTRVYLLHDPTTRVDAEFAAGLQAQLREKEKLDVVFPPAGLCTATDYRERHRQQLQSSDGVLLYWNAAPETWFEQYIPDVLYQGRKARTRSKAFLLDDPSQMDQQSVPVIRRSPDFRLSDLEPFLQPLRAGEVVRASA